MKCLIELDLSSEACLASVAGGSLRIELSCALNDLSKRVFRMGCQPGMRLEAHDTDGVVIGYLSVWENETQRGGENA